MGQSPCEGFKKGEGGSGTTPCTVSIFSENVYFGSMLRFFKEAS